MAVRNSRANRRYTNGTSRKTTDGTTWATGPSFPTNVVNRPIPVAGGVLYQSYYTSLGPNTLYRFNGTTSTSVHTSVKDHCLGTDTTVYLLTGSTIKSGSADGMSWTTELSDAPSSGRTLAVTDDAFFVGTDDSHLWPAYRYGMGTQPPATSEQKKPGPQGGSHGGLPALAWCSPNLTEATIRGVA
jgi:hypothetical protein